MKKLKLMAVSIAGVMTVSTTTTIVEVSAAEQMTTSTGSVTFEEPEVVDPEITIPGVDPEEIVDPEGGGPSSNGPLRIDHASNIDFGVHSISANNEIYKANLNQQKTATGDVYVSTFAQVTDNRGTNGGWKLSISATPFQIEGTESIIKDAKLRIVEVPNVTNNYGYDADTTPTGNASPENIIGATASIAIAKENQGMGQWHVTLGSTGKYETNSQNEAIELEIPGKSQTLPGQVYQSILTWTLSDSI